MIWDISHMSGGCFSMWIQLWCLFCDWTTLFGNNFRNTWYETYHTCPGLVFQCEFNCDVCFVIGLPYLVILANAIIRVNKTTLAYSIWYISRLQFSFWIWRICANLQCKILIQIWQMFQLLKPFLQLSEGSFICLICGSK